MAMGATRIFPRGSGTLVRNLRLSRLRIFLRIGLGLLVSNWNVDGAVPDRIEFMYLFIIYLLLFDENQYLRLLLLKSQDD
jgi:hypothetical protein